MPTRATSTRVDDLIPADSLDEALIETAPKVPETAPEVLKTAPEVLKTAPKRKRISFHKRKRLGIDQEKGYHYRLVNNEGDRIAAFKDAGYSFVDGKVRDGQKDASDGSQFGKVACQSVGNGVMAYYMRIPDEYFKEDQADKQRELDDFDKRVGFDKIPKHVRRGSVKIDYGPPGK